MMEFNSNGTGTGTNLVLSRLEAHGLTVHGSGPWLAQCPNHEDREASLSIKQADDRVLLNCFAGCPTSDVISAIGLEWRDLFADTITSTPTRRTHQRPKVVPVPPKPKTEIDRVLYAFDNAGMTWRAGERLGTWRCECPACADPRLTVWAFDPGVRDEDRAGEPVQVTCANGCSPRVIAYMLRTRGGWTS